MKKEELYDKLSDVIDMFKQDEASEEDTLNHIYVLMTKYMYGKFDEYEANIIHSVNENVKLEDNALHDNVVFGIKKAKLPEFEAIEIPES